MLPPLPHHRQHRQEDDDDDGLVDLLPEDGEGRAEEVAGEHQPEDPEHGTDGRPGEEALAIHLADASDDGDEGPHDRHEAADDQRLVAVLVEEGLGLVEVLALDDPAVALSQLGPDGPADLIASDIAAKGGDEECDQGDRQADRQVATGNEEAHREEKAVAGEDREEQAALDEDDEQGDDEELRPEALEQPRRVHPARAEGREHRHDVSNHEIKGRCSS